MANRGAYIVVDNKGGVGKSMLALLLGDLLRHEFGPEQVAFRDTDLSNSVLKSLYSAETEVIDIGHVAASARLGRVLAEGPQDHAVYDIGAGQEGAIRRMLHTVFLPACERAKRKLHVIRPITTSSFTQMNAVDFAKEFAPALKEGAMTLTLVRVEAMGREPADYAHWQQSSARASILKAGARETYMSDLGAVYADEMVAFNLSPTEIARGDFSRVADPEDAKKAADIFDLDVRYHFANWLIQHQQRVAEAVGLSLKAKAR